MSFVACFFLQYIINAIAKEQTRKSAFLFDRLQMHAKLNSNREHTHSLDSSVHVVQG